MRLTGSKDTDAASVQAQLDRLYNESDGWVAHQVNALERLGYLRKDAHRPRAYVPTDHVGDDNPFLSDDTPLSALVLVPLVGQIAAGAPITAEQQVEELLPILATMLPERGPFFALRVRGDSMSGSGAHILDGDIVAALIDDTEATVKRLHNGGHSGTWLLPANAS